MMLFFMFSSLFELSERNNFLAAINKIPARNNFFHFSRYPIYLNLSNIYALLNGLCLVRHVNDGKNL